MASASRLTVDEILSDLEKLGVPFATRATPAQSTAALATPPSEFFALGRTLMPEHLQITFRHDGTHTQMPQSVHSGQQKESKMELDQLQSILEDQGKDNAQERDRAALQLSQLYIDSARRAMSLDTAAMAARDGNMTPSSVEDKGDANRFEVLQRRVAQMQAQTEEEARAIGQAIEAIASGSK